jgi:hypothetical protein
MSPDFVEISRSLTAIGAFLLSAIALWRTGNWRNDDKSAAANKARDERLAGVETLINPIASARLPDRVSALESGQQEMRALLQNTAKIADVERLVVGQQALEKHLGRLEGGVERIHDYLLKAGGQ